MTFRAVGFPSQCAFVPLGRVTLSGTNLFCLANAKYVSVVDGLRYLGRSRQRSLARRRNRPHVDKTDWLWAMDVRPSMVRSAVNATC